MIGAYFVSDVHLGSLEDQRAQLFLSFLKGLEGPQSNNPNCSELFLMGDIFDMWIGGHKYYIQKYSVVVGEVRRLVNEGAQVHYFEGNHDLYLNRFWGKKVGVNIHKGPEYFELGGQFFRVEHGDEMDPTDKGYLFLRWFLRTPFMRLLSLILPGFLVKWIGETSSKHSRTYTTETKSISDDRAIGVIRSHAQKVHSERPFDLILSGHVHVRDEFEFYASSNEDNSQTSTSQAQEGASSKRVKSINLGTWLKKPCYYYFQEHGGQLIELT